MSISPARRGPGAGHGADGASPRTRLRGPASSCRWPFVAGVCHAGGRQDPARTRKSGHSSARPLVRTWATEHAIEPRDEGSRQLYGHASHRLPVDRNGECDGRGAAGDAPRGLGPTLALRTKPRAAESAALRKRRHATAQAPKRQPGSRAGSRPRPRSAGPSGVAPPLSRAPSPRSRFANQREMRARTPSAPRR